MQAELDLGDCLRPVGLGDGVGPAGAAEEPLALAEGAQRAEGMLDARLPAQIEDQHRRAVRQLASATKRGSAFLVGVKRADVERGKAARREALDAPRAALGSVLRNAKTVHGSSSLAPFAHDIIVKLGAKMRSVLGARLATVVAPAGPMSTTGSERQTA